ncbi:hypothetical protein [Rhizohabitans arisaemae]|uniref:hypothetical protein n=1 Tax=Rhizohabitans arisaemae TaxID=2720610 RepID=UPI0024B1D553|nr:hypothetical protein [Rhizohabitans arisaemae]
MSVFYDEWDRRAPGSRRSLERARMVRDRLGLTDPSIPILTVVGSKGKGTAATHASAVLAAAGRTVVTVTSPALRGDRERIRVNGAAVSVAEFENLAERLSSVLSGLPAGTGHLSPSGLFTLAGVLHATTVGADLLVLEAGMGGRSDEVSLFPPTVVAVTEIFAEHVGVLGADPPEIAREKAGVAGPATRALVTLPQTPEVRAAMDEVTPNPRLTWEITPSSAGWERNAELGRAAARRLLRLLGIPRPETVPPVRLPGRLSFHPIPGGELLADCAISRTGVAVALATARRRWDTIDRVLLCLPDHKDLDGAIGELAGLPVTFVRLPYAHLRFERPVPWPVVEADELALPRGRVLALGTVYFIGRVLALADVDTERLFTVDHVRPM